jgi:hypothetical protein
MATQVLVPCTHEPLTADPRCACNKARAQQRAGDPRMLAADRLAMAVRTSRRCVHEAGTAACFDPTCRALAGYEAVAR